MKKITGLLLTCLLLCLCGGCSSGSSAENSSTAPAVSVNASSEDTADASDGDLSETAEASSVFSHIVKGAETPTTARVSVKSPLTVGEWGSAAKFCTSNNRYVEVPVRIVSIRRGTEVNEEVRQLMEQGGQYFFEPSDNEEYALAEYEICLNDFPMSKSGTLCDITAFITGEDGDALALDDGAYWGTTVACLDQKTYFHGGVVHSLMAYRIIKGRTDYLITAGEYEETQTFFKGQ